jgi:mannitol/fructose-specific phosphotransferase system IIA component (Ntr-type)
MGECISKMSQILFKNGYATIKSIREENVEREEKSSINPKIAIVLKKSADFDRLTEGLTLREN